MKSLKQFINEGRQYVDEASVNDLVDIVSKRTLANKINLSNASPYIQIQMIGEFGQFYQQFVEKISKKYSSEDDEISPSDVKYLENGIDKICNKYRKYSS